MNEQAYFQQFDGECPDKEPDFYAVKSGGMVTRAISRAQAEQIRTEYQEVEPGREWVIVPIYLYKGAMTEHDIVYRYGNLRRHCA